MIELHVSKYSCSLHNILSSVHSVEFYASQEIFSTEGSAEAVYSSYAMSDGAVLVQIECTTQAEIETSCRNFI